MKKIAKKFISVFLALSITLQVAVTAYAEAGVNLSGKERVYEILS